MNTLEGKTKTELKALAYETIVQMEQLKRQLAIIEQEIVKPEDDDTVKEIEQ